MWFSKMTIARNPFPHTSVFLSRKICRRGCGLRDWVGWPDLSMCTSTTPASCEQIIFYACYNYEEWCHTSCKDSFFFVCSIPTFVHPVCGETATSCDLALLHLHVCTWLYVCGWHMYLALSSCTINRIGGNYIGDRGKAALTEAAKSHPVDVSGLGWVHMFTTLTSMHNNNACAQDVSK